MLERLAADEGRRNSSSLICGRLFASWRTHNTYFRAICMMRGSPADKILPKVELDRVRSGQTALVPVGGQGFIWLGMLNISARNMMDCFSRIRKVRDKLMSI